MKSEQIREAYQDLEPSALNKEIAATCLQKFGFRPTSQQIYSALGSEMDRRLKTYNGREMQVASRTMKEFDWDIGRATGALQAVRGLSDGR